MEQSSNCLNEFPKQYIASLIAFIAVFHGVLSSGTRKLWREQESVPGALFFSPNSCNVHEVNLLKYKKFWDDA